MYQADFQSVGQDLDAVGVNTHISQIIQVGSKHFAPRGLCVVLTQLWARRLCYTDTEACTGLYVL
jgi:hypothetical protein